MSNYFSYFPTTEHDLTGDGDTVTVTNILKRFAFRKSNMDTLDIFSDFNISEGDRPDIIAEKYYNDSRYSWVVLLFNTIIDPFYEWPLFGENFRNYLVAKYGSIEAAHQTTKKYYRILYQSFKKIDGTVVPTKKLEIDLTTYNSLGSNEKSTQTAYEWEDEQNNNRMSIRLLDPLYLKTVLEEAESILKTST